MQNRKAIWFFTILLIAACLYQLSFSWMTSRFEKKAEGEAGTIVDSIVVSQGENPIYELSQNEELDLTSESAKERLKDYFTLQILKSKRSEEVFLGYTYQECMQKRLKMGLDLQGGMSVTLEISVPSVVETLAGNTKNVLFRKPFDAASERMKTTSEDFITVFREEFEKANPQGDLARIFNAASPLKFEPNISNDEVEKNLRTYAQEALKGTEEVLKARVDRFGVANPTIQRIALSDRFIIELPGESDKENVRSLLKSTAILEFWETYPNGYAFQELQKANDILRSELYPNIEEEIKLLEEEFAQANDSTKNEGTSEEDDILADENSDELNLDEEVTSSSDELNTEETASTLSEEKKLEIQRKANPIMALISPNVYQSEQGLQWAQGSMVGYVATKDTALLNNYLNHPEVKAILPEDLSLMYSYTALKGNQNVTTLFAIRKTENGIPELDGKAIAEAYHSINEKGQVEISVAMTGDATPIWAEMTARNAQKASVAIALDNSVLTSPWVNDAITGGRTAITGSYTIDEAKKLSSLLAAGALPAKAEIVEESIVGPTLGAENISSGLNSFIMALFVVLLYMIFYYGKSGLVADIAMLLNLFLLIGVLAAFKAALTLPGIAGIVLTIGMSVDANVLIFERVREELRAKKGIKLAVKEGYSKALAAILDANITTLLTAVVLYTFGSGPIQGFAITLIIGIFTSLFSALFITRLIITKMLDDDKAVTFATKKTENAFVGSKVNFLAKRKLYYIISSIVVIGGIASMASRGFDLGVEFTGGRTFTVEFKEAPNLDDVRTSLGSVFVEEGRQLEPEVKVVDNQFKAKITTKYLVNDESTTADTNVETALNQGLSSFGAYTIIQQNKINPSISSAIMTSSLFAIVFSLIVIFLYIIFRFRKWQYGLGALLAMAHDVIVVLGIFSIFYGILPFSMEIDQAFIAAILTVVGYSINDTVVVFDRIRERVTAKTKGQDVVEITNGALNSTLSRTISTSLSTFVVLLIIFLFGGEAIKGFTFALMLGVAVGTYSSLCIATPSLIDFSSKKNKEK